MITEIYIGTDRLDLYDDENIVITSSVANIQEVDKIYTDFSRDINIPANAKNNKILKHWYNFDVVNGFDNRIKKPAKISLGGADFKYGKMNISKVKYKNNKPYNYTLSYVGNLVDLKDKLGDDKLEDLDFSDVDFYYTSDNVLDKLSEDTPEVAVSLFTNKRMIFDSSENVDETDTQTNIYYNNNNDNSGIKWNELKLSVRMDIIFNAIQSKYDISFSNDFINQYTFWSRYLLLDKNTEAQRTEQQIPLNSTDDPLVDLVTNSIPSKPKGDRFYCNINLVSGAGLSEDAVYYFIVKTNGKELLRKELKGSSSFEWSSVSPNLTMHVESETNIGYTYEMERRLNIGSIAYFTYSNPGVPFPAYEEIENIYSVSDNIPDMKVYDFLQGIIKANKIVLIPQNDGSIYLDTLQNYYKKGSLIRGLERYVDVSSFTIEDQEKNNVISYQFEEPNTILNMKFLELYGRGYGDSDKRILDDNGNLIDGEELEYDIPFEQVIYEQIFDIGDDPQASPTIVYGLITDDNVEPTSTKGHIHYLTRQTIFNPLLNLGIKVINDNGVGVKVNSGLNMPSHGNYANNPSDAFVFSNDQSVWSGEPLSNNLYSNYHQNYIEKITDKKTRYFVLTCKRVPVNILNEIKLNDALEWKDKLYRIDKMEVNISNGDIKFYLYNDINIDLDYIEPVTFDRDDITFDNTIITFDRI